MARKNAIVTVEATDALVTFTVADVGSFNIDTMALSDDVRTRAIIHGVVQKVSDAAALGKDATSSDKFAAMESVMQRIVAGDWNKRAGDGSSAPVAGIIYRAFAEWANSTRAKGKQIADEKLRAVYAAKSRSDQLALRNVPEIAAVIERIKSESGPKSSPVDTDALLGELAGL